MKILYTIVFILTACLSQGEKNAPKNEPDIWTNYSENEFNKSYKQKSIILYFWADWCAPCHQLRKLTFSNLEVQKELQKFSLMKINSTETNQELEKLQEKYAVESLPVVIFINKDGNVRKDLTLRGFEPPLDFLKRLEKF